MLTIKISFNDNTGSFALDAIAQTVGGDWDSCSSTNSSGIVTNVDEGNREFVEEILEADDNVESYTIIEA